MYAELQRRKATVEDSKNRERAEKAGKIAGADPQAGLLERGDVSMTRGEGPALIIDYGSENLPPVVPSITSFGKGAAGATLGAPEVVNAAAATGNSAAIGVMDGSAFGGEGEEYSYSGEAAPAASASSAGDAAASAPSAAASAAPAPLFTSTGVQSFTRFSCSAFGSRAPELYASLQSHFLSLGFSIQASSKKKEKYKFSLVKCVTAQGIILFSAAIYSDPASPTDSLIVDFKKRSADGAQFRTLFAEIRCQMKELVDQKQSVALATPQQPVPQQQAGTTQ